MPSLGIPVHMPSAAWLLPLSTLGIWAGLCTCQGEVPASSLGRGAPPTQLTTADTALAPCGGIACQVSPLWLTLANSVTLS